jgi:hypothetical protein
VGDQRRVGRFVALRGTGPWREGGGGKRGDAGGQPGFVHGHERAGSLWQLFVIEGETTWACFGFRNVSLIFSARHRRPAAAGLKGDFS